MTWRDFIQVIMNENSLWNSWNALVALYSVKGSKVTLIKVYGRTITGLGARVCFV